MIDIHSHILFGIDDGSRDLEESLKMVISAKKNGFTGIVCTSHYNKKDFNIEIYNKNFSLLKEKVNEIYPNFMLYSGNEIFLSTDILTDLSNNKIQTLNSSKYILLEFDPLMTFIPIKNALEKILKLDYVPILAHVERYKKLELKELLTLKKLNIPFQMNISSVNNFYHKKALTLLKNSLIDFIASDAHRNDKRNYDIDNDLNKIKQFITDDEFKRLVSNTYLISQNLPIKFGENTVLKKKIIREKYNIFKKIFSALK